MFAVMTLRTHRRTTAIFVSSLALTAAAPPEISPEADALFAQPLAPFEDACINADGLAIRHLRFATLDASGSNEDRLELRMTVAPDGLRLDYLVNDGVAFTQIPCDREGVRAGTGFLPARMDRRLADACTKPHAASAAS